MPNGFLPPIPNYRNGAMALGDAFNMRHPLTGGGMSVAFHDIIIFRKLLLNVKDLTDYEALSRVSKRLYGGRKSSHSFVVNILSMSLYELFAANDSKWTRISCIGTFFKQWGFQNFKIKFRVFKTSAERLLPILQKGRKLRQWPSGAAFHVSELLDYCLFSK